jgi:plastocyanin
MIANRRVRVAAAIIVVVFAACSSDADVGLPAGGEPTAGGSPSGVQPTVAASATGSDGSDTSTANADVVATSFRFDPSTIEVGEGEDLTVVNGEETVDHTFTIEEEDLDEILPAGDEANVRADLPAGTYTVICRFHVDQGMEATLEVG